MNDTTNAKQNSYIKRFFSVVAKGQSYLNLIYLLLAFPLGLFYFIFLVTGLSLGISLLIIWIGVLILLFMLAAWWGLALLERQLAIRLLRVDIPPMSRESTSEQGVWARLKAHLKNPVTWKGLAYLFAKFPIGVLSFVVVVTLTALTARMVVAPALYRSPTIDYTAENFSVHADDLTSLGPWQVDTLGKALICSILGIGVGLLSMHLFNVLAFALGRFALLMLGSAQSTLLTEEDAESSGELESEQ